MKKNFRNFSIKFLYLILVVLMLLPFSGRATVPDGVSQPPAGTATTASTFSMPLAFEENQGQVDAAVKYLVHGRNQSLFLTPSEAVLKLAPRANFQSQPAIVRLSFVNGNPQTYVEGVSRLPGVVNYYLGQDPAGWQAGIPTYARVRYQDIFPGIDAEFYGNQQEIEHDFVVKPGSKPEAIDVKVTGSLPDDFRLRISEAGGLQIRTTGGQLELRRPTIYQDRKGQREMVAGEYRLTGADTFGFSVAAYDPTLPLVIDPVIDFSTYFGGSANDYGYGITTDSTGNVYLTGATNSADFPGTNGGYAGAGSQCPSDLPTRECYDAFVTKINSTGTAILYSTYIGNPGEDEGRAIAVDNNGNAYITGLVSMNGAPPLEEMFIYKYALVVKLGPTGNMVFGFYWGEGSDLIGYGIDVDSQGRIYVGGEVSSAILTTPNAIQPNKGEMTDGFISVFSADGTSVVYSTYLGGNDTYCGVCASKVMAVAVDGAGKIYATGQAAPSYPVTNNAYRKTFDGLWEAFVAKIDPSKAGLAGLEYSTYLGGLDTDIGHGITMDAQGMIYVTGSTQSYDFPTTPGAFDRACGTDSICNPTTVCGPEIPPTCYTDPKTDVFVAKMDLSKSGAASLLYSTYVGGGGQEIGYSIAVDSNGKAYVTGSTWSPNFPVANPIQASYSAKLDTFVFTLNASASQLEFSTFIGGGSDDEAYSISLDPAGRAYITGYTGSGAYPVVNPLLVRSTGWEAVVTRIVFGSQVIQYPVFLPMVKK